MFDAGSAAARYILDISDARKSANELRALFAQIKRDQTAINSGSGSNNSSALATQASGQQKVTSSILARANAEARLAQVQNTGKNAVSGLTQAEQIYATALTKVNAGSTEAIRIQTQLAAVQNRLQNVSGGGLATLPRSLENFGPQALQQIQSGLLGIVGPAALVTAGFAAVGKAIDLTEESFRLKAALDQTTASINIQLKGVRDTGVIFSSAQQFAAKYNLTQQETNEALKASVGILRNSTSSASDLLGVLARLQVASPEQGLEGAALAVKELQSGDIQSLVERFEISRSAANKMKEEIKGGADAVAVLSKYLSDSGITMEALSVRTEGAAGKMNELKVATEQFSLALGEDATGPGLAILQGRIALTRNATNLLHGDTQTLINDFGALTLATNPLSQVLAGVVTVDDALIGKFNTLAGTSIPGVLQPLKDSIGAWGDLAKSILGIPAGIPGSDRLKDDLINIRREANATADAIAAALGNKPGKHINDTGASVGGATGGLGDRLTKGFDRVVAASAAADRQAAALDQVNFDNRLKKAKDNAAKIALLRAREAQTADPVERAKIEGQIIDLQNQKTSGLRKELNLQESIFDSVNKQLHAQLDIQSLTIKDRQDRRKEDQEIRRAQNILSSGRASPEFRAAAADRLALINVERQQRALDIADKQRTAGGSIVNGRILQSRPSDGSATAPVPQGTTTGGGSATPTSPQEATSGTGGVDVRVYLDSQQIAAKIVTTMHGGLRQSISAGS